MGQLASGAFDGSGAGVFPSGSGVATVNLTAAQIIAMGTTPVSLMASPGAGMAIIVDNITVKMVTTATAFTGGGAVEFRYTNASGAKVTADVAAAVVTAGVAADNDAVMMAAADASIIVDASVMSRSNMA